MHRIFALIVLFFGIHATAQDKQLSPKARELTQALIWNDLVKYCFSCFLLPHFLFSFRLSLEGSASRGRGGYCDG
jgi:hypothetical protein